MTRTFDWLRSHVDYDGDDCLTWPFGGCNGYGMCCVGGRKRQYAHRVMCELVHGEAPSAEHEAAHSCGKGHLGCVNPKHIQWKTRSENQLDRHEHGTVQRGSRGRLTFAEAEKIRSMKGRMTQNELAKIYGVTRGTINHIHAGRTYKKELKGVVAYGLKFGARIKISNEDVNLGTFETAELAAAAYQTKLAEILGKDRQ